MDNKNMGLTAPWLSVAVAWRFLEAETSPHRRLAFFPLLPYCLGVRRYMERECQEKNDATYVSARERNGNWTKSVPMLAALWSLLVTTLGRKKCATYQLNERAISAIPRGALTFLWDNGKRPFLSLSLSLSLFFFFFIVFILSSNRPFFHCRFLGRPAGSITSMYSSQCLSRIREHPGVVQNGYYSGQGPLDSWKAWW